MLQVRIHGRGGQGVVTAFCRIDDRPVRVREPVMEPDALIVPDATLPHQVDVFAEQPGPRLRR